MTTKIGLWNFQLYKMWLVCLKLELFVTWVVTQLRDKDRMGERRLLSLSCLTQTMNVTRCANDVHTSSREIHNTWV